MEQSFKEYFLRNRNRGWQVLTGHGNFNKFVEIMIVYPLFDIGFDTGVPISLLVRTLKQWENRPFKTPFYVNASNRL
jgi:hypothetical protein